MKKILCTLTALLLLCTAACGQADTQTAADETASSGTASVTFEDDLGRTVTVENPQRVAALIGSYADIWCLAGGQDTLVAAANDTWTTFDLDLSEEVVNLGVHTEISLESLLAAEPDFVIASTNTDVDLTFEEPLTEAGIPIAYFHVDSFEEYENMLSILTQITDRPDLYDQYGTQVEAQVEEAKALSDGSQPTVLYIRATGSSVKAKNSEGSVLGEMLADLDTINVADSDEGLLENLSLESILADDPDYIFVVYQGSDSTDAEALMEDTLLSNPAWSTLRAVEEGRFVVLDSSLYNTKPNAQWGLAYAQLADLLYGE